MSRGPSSEAMCVHFLLVVDEIAKLIFVEDFYDVSFDPVWKSSAVDHIGGIPKLANWSKILQKKISLLESFY